MTIIQPHKKLNITFYLFGVSFLIIFSGMLAVYMYNSLVNLRYSMSENTKFLEQLSVENAELRNAVSRMANPETLEILAQQINFKKDRSPEYLSKNKWPLASQF